MKEDLHPTKNRLCGGLAMDDLLRRNWFVFLGGHFQRQQWVVQYVTSWMLERGTKVGEIATRTNMWRLKIGIVGPEPMSVGG